MILNSFQRWAKAYAEAMGATAEPEANWVRVAQGDSAATCTTEDGVRTWLASREPVTPRFRCVSCGSTKVLHDALVRWNGAHWEVASLLDAATCEDCGSERIEERIS